MLTDSTEITVNICTSDCKVIKYIDVLNIFLLFVKKKYHYGYSLTKKNNDLTSFNQFLPSLNVASRSII